MRRSLMKAKMPESKRLRKQWNKSQRWWYEQRLDPVFVLGGMVVVTVWLFVIIFFLTSQFQSSRVLPLPSMLAVMPHYFHQGRNAVPSVKNRPMASEVLTDGHKSSHTQANEPTPPSTPLGSQTACLAMIIKNEGPILPRLFESVKGFVSEYCIVDTGSTDDTIDVLRSIDMPGVILEEPFVNFATTRNYMIDNCRKVMTCDYLVLLDADMVLHVSPDWDWSKLDGRDVYNFIQISGVEYENVRMIRRAAEEVHVVGATHEYYHVPTEYTKGLIPKHLVYIEDVGDGKAKGDKFQRDERLLRHELQEQPDNVRTIFYLANTLKDQGKYEEAIPFYERRATMGGWFAEADYSYIMLTQCYLELHNVAKARMYAELAAYTRVAQRAEPLYHLVFYFHRHGHYELAWYYCTLALKIPKPEVSQALFILNSIYEYWLDYERASLSQFIFPNESTVGLHASWRFLNNVNAPNDLRDYFYLDLARYAPTIPFSSTTNRILHRHTNTPETNMPILTKTKEGSLRMLVPEVDQQGCVWCRALKMQQGVTDKEDFGKAGLVHLNLPKDYAPDIHFTALPGMLVGISSDARFIYRGDMHDAQEQTVILRTYTTPDIAITNSWLLFAKGGSTFGLTSWYPAITIERLIFNPEKLEVTCKPMSSIRGNVPRIFSFFKKASNGIEYKGDLYFLFKWRHTSVALYSLLILRSDDFQVKGYTYPFAFKEEGIDDIVCSGLEIFEEAEDASVVVACAAGGATSEPVTGLVAKLSLTKLLAWTV